MKLITVQDIANIVKLHGFNNFMLDLTKQIKNDFSRWQDFDKSPRHAIHVKDGVIELMPVADSEFYTFKYVNGHPKNPFNNKQTVIATGQLSNVVDGYPILFSEMTTLTAFRTAATSMIATDLLSKKNATTIAIIGTGAQSEFQVLAHTLIRDIKNVQYFDIDPNAMHKFYNNLISTGLNLIACQNAQDALKNADIVIVCTACKGHVDVIKNDWLIPGMHINALGGDCPGKTELEAKILLNPNCKIVVEYFPQSLIEGEIQRLSEDAAQNLVYAELWELITHKKQGRIDDKIITIFDSVGFALEDYSVLLLINNLAKHYNIGTYADFIPPIKDPKNLISVLNNFTHKEELCKKYQLA